MILKAHRWGPQAPHYVVCVHGVAQHGGVYEDLAQRLVAAGHSVLAVDAAGVERVSWIGHSFGGRLVAEAAAVAPERSERLVLLDPALGVPAGLALRNAEIERLDWSFATIDGALNQLPTLILRAARPLFTPDGALESRYRETLGELLTMATVPNGHNLLWESPAETGEAIERFIGPA